MDRSMALSLVLESGGGCPCLTIFERRLFASVCAFYDLVERVDARGLAHGDEGRLERVRLALQLLVVRPERRQIRLLGREPRLEQHLLLLAQVAAELARELAPRDLALLAPRVHAARLLGLRLPRLHGPVALALLDGDEALGLGELEDGLRVARLDGPRHGLHVLVLPERRGPGFVHVREVAVEGHLVLLEASEDVLELAPVVEAPVRLVVDGLDRREQHVDLRRVGRVGREHLLERLLFHLEGPQLVEARLERRGLAVRRRAQLVELARVEVDAPLHERERRHRRRRPAAPRRRLHGRRVVGRAVREVRRPRPGRQAPHGLREVLLREHGPLRALRAALILDGFQEHALGVLLFRPGRRRERAHRRRLDRHHGATGAPGRVPRARRSADRHQHVE